MILSTHAIVGAAIASFMPEHPALAFVAGIASHFAIDAIPHSDYPLRSISIGRSRSAVTFDHLLLRDLLLIAFDTTAGIAIALWLYAGAGVTFAVLAGAIGAILPDPLRLAYRLYPKEPLQSLQRFHVWIHTNRKLSPKLAIVSQVGFVLLTIGLADVLRYALSSNPS
jgi:hypothetical protein